MKIKDLRNQLVTHATKRYTKRKRRSIQTIAIHHSATVNGSAQAFARYHVEELGWPGIGYHYVIDKVGQIAQTNALETVSYHVGNANRQALGICLVGDFTKERLNDEQEKSLHVLLESLMKSFRLSTEDILGHNEFPGYNTTQCPGFDMVELRHSLEEALTGVQKVNKPTESKLLRRGQQGADVKELQRDLTKQGYILGQVDGIFGPLTEKALREFQKDHSLLVDGIYGPESTRALKGSSKTRERNLSLRDPWMRGEDVKAVQRAVGAAVDGIFGPETERAVRRFQQRNNLIVDGIVGPQTYKAIEKRE
ncbi:peptidoglycan recognition protein family protein [Alteribacter populi]|uniref:peptidoglycan recognition protein family protein n=1 Tax=Alteribacter populi TaxID=2011011 RepID=UPI000BBA9C4C|nr:N-acetylmuramoyl-L-alanine amidase [Alteribacter populi]